MRDKKSRRIAPSSAYIGAGNRTDVFTLKARKPFQALHEVYKDGIPNKEGEDYRKAFRKLTEAEKDKIKSKIRAQAVVEKKQRIIKALIAIALTILIIAFIIIILKTFYWQ